MPAPGKAAVPSFRQARRRPPAPDSAVRSQINCPGETQPQTEKRPGFQALSVPLSLGIALGLRPPALVGSALSALSKALGFTEGDGTSLPPGHAGLRGV